MRYYIQDFIPLKKTWDSRYGEREKDMNTH